MAITSLMEGNNLHPSMITRKRMGVSPGAVEFGPQSPFQITMVKKAGMNHRERVFDFLLLLKYSLYYRFSFSACFTLVISAFPEPGAHLNHIFQMITVFL